ncbi:MAG: hypothetical protein FWD52_09205, partial [Candidatus Bathyarchaeota archaeon]|nr:hypothetical protein [Candidatus Termiticorpusculum sp.]
KSECHFATLLCKFRFSCLDKVGKVWTYAHFLENSSFVMRVDGVVVTHAPDITCSGVTVSPGGTLFLLDGEISGNKVSNHGGGGVYNGGSFTMSGGKISGNRAYRTSISTRAGTSYVDGNGGGVCNAGVFKMSGGIISGNTAGCGDGVYNQGVFKLSGGVISNNNGRGAAWAVYNTEHSTFDKTGGVVVNGIVVVGVVVCVSIVLIIFVFLFFFFKKKKRIQSGF